VNPYQEAIQRFRRTFARARQGSVADPTAMALATSSAQGTPTVRMVLLKEANERGFVFYTNLESRKGKTLRGNPRAGLCFYWPRIKEQILIEGRVKPVSPQEADAYWATRPRLSQIGAWASHQSRPMKDPRHLLNRVALYEKKFAGRNVPRPPYWSGFRLIPFRIEFWKQHAFRLHHRLEYRKSRSGWRRRMLFP